MSVIVYITPTCGFCRQVKAYLKQRSAPFTEHDVSRDRAAAMQMVQLSGQQGVPVVVIDGQVVLGFNRPRIDHLLAQRYVRLETAITDAGQTITDPLYGTWPLPAGVAQLLACPTLQRLHRVSQSGASKYAHPFKTITRLEHSIGVYLLLRRLGAAEQEQIAGLLHDVSHTAFSHVIDIVFYSVEQDFHEGIKAEFLNRPDLRAALDALGYRPADFLSDELYTLLEQPLPALCADRIDYSLRDAVTVGEINIPAARTILNDLAVHHGRIVMRDPAVAQQYVTLFKKMNNTYWASQQENYLYETLAQAIEVGLETGILSWADMLVDDDVVEAKLRAANDPHIASLFNKLFQPPADEVTAFWPTRPIKQRAIDPHILLDGTVAPLSST